MAEVTYYDYINAFYELLKVNPPSSSAQLLYHTLLMEYNNAHWQSVELQRTNTYIARLCSISEKSLIKAKNELKQLGLIDFKSAKKQSTIYFLTVKSTVKKEVKSAVKGEVKTQYKRQEKVQAYKDKRDKIKDIDITPVVPCDEKIKYASNVKLTEKEHEALTQKYGESDTRRLIEILDSYKEAKGKEYKSDYGAINKWVVIALAEEKQRKGANTSVYDDSNMNYDELEKIMQEKM